MPETNSEVGRFIAVEGLDGAGTSTQTGLLASWLRARGLDVFVTKEPSTGAIGNLIRQVLADSVTMDQITLALAFAADRVDHIESTGGIRAQLDAGSWVISDRYVLSSLAYQGSDGLPFDWLLEINRFALTPDLTVFIDTSPETCMQRIEQRGGAPERFEGLERSRKTLLAYHESLKQGDFLDSIIGVSGEGTREEVLAKLTRELDSWLPSSPGPQASQSAGF